MNVSKPGSAASELVAFEVVERGRKGLRVRREVSISFLTLFSRARVFFGVPGVGASEVGVFVWSLKVLESTLGDS